MQKKPKDKMKQKLKNPNDYERQMSRLKKGGSAKKKSKFPDHSGDGKITKKDILMAKELFLRKKRRDLNNG